MANRTKYIRLTNRRGNRYTKPHLEVLEDRRVLNAYIWNAPATNPFPAFTDPTNWTDQATGQTAVTAPDVNTDCIYSASSRGASLITRDAFCRSITTDPNWVGSINITNTMTLHVYGGTSLLKGGNIVEDNGSGTLDVNGGTFDYDGSNINDVPYAGGHLTVYINNGATFTVDKDCLNTNSNFRVGKTPDGTDNTGTLIFNTITPSHNIPGDNTSVFVSTQGTAIYNPGAHSTSSNGNVYSFGTVVINDNVSLSLNAGLTMDGGGFLETIGSGSAYISNISLTQAELQMSSNQGKYFHLSTDLLSIQVGSTFAYYVDGNHLSSSDTVDVSGPVYLSGSTSICMTDGTNLSPGDHSYTPISSSSSINGQFTHLVWKGDTPEVWSVAYPGSSFNLSGTIVPPPPPPTPHNFVWSPTTTDTNWSNPNNWTDSVTGLRETNAPGPNDDVVFGATSPTRCDLFTNGTCQTITTDPSWNGHIVLHNSRLSVYGVNAPAGKSSVINGGAIDVVLGGTVDEIGGVFDYAVSELGAGLSGFGRLNVAIENSGKFIVDRECQTINACFFVGQSYPSINPASPGILEFDTTDPNLTYSMSVRSVISVSQKGTVNFTDGSVMSGLALVDYGTVNLGTNVVLTTPTMGLLHAILVESGGILNTAPTGAITTINGDLNVLGGGTLRMNGDGAGLYSALVLNGTLTVGGIVDVGFDVGYFNGSAIQANQTNILQGSTLSITTEGTPQPAGFPYLFPVIYGPITGSFSTVVGVTDPITFNDGSELVVEWLQA